MNDDYPKHGTVDFTGESFVETRLYGINIWYCEVLGPSYMLTVEDTQIEAIDIRVHFQPDNMPEWTVWAERVTIGEPTRVYPEKSQTEREPMARRDMSAIEKRNTIKNRLESKHEEVVYDGTTGVVYTQGDVEDGRRFMETQLGVDLQEMSNKSVIANFLSKYPDFDIKKLA